MCEEYKTYSELSKDEANPGGMDLLPNPHNFSNNPGFINPGTTDMLMSARPGNGETGTIRTAGGGTPGPRVSGGGPQVHSTFGKTSPNPTLGRSASNRSTSVAMPAPGDTDPGAEGNPLGRTSGFGG